MSILGIIPAAGEGSRWGGYFKELLPVKDKTLIDRSIVAMRMGGAKKIAVVSKPDKIATHSKYLSNRHSRIFYLIQSHKPELFGAVDEALNYAMDYDYTYFAMPDTYFPLFTFQRDFSHADFHLGLFLTQATERFGVLYNGVVVDKQKFCKVDVFGQTFSAWGVLIWNKKVSKFWWEKEPKDYTDAINLAMKNFTWDTFYLDYYYDMASWKDYEEFIKSD